MGGIPTQEAAAYLAYRIAEDRWQPIETAPRDNRPVLLWFPEGMPRDHVVIARWQRGLWSFKNHHSWGSCVRGLPSHWMPLPPPPVAS